MSVQQSNTPVADKPIEDKALSQDDVFNFINDESVPEETDKKDKVPPPPDKKEDGEEEVEEEKEEKPEEDEIKLIEEELDELEEPSEDKLEVVAPVRRQEILKKYPTIFKDFPYLEKAYYREQQFTKVFPTIDEAKSAADSVKTLANFEEDIVDNGNQVNILKLIHRNNPKAFARIADDYLDNLHEVDEKAFNHVVSNVTKDTIKAMWDEGKASKNQELMKAAVELNEFIFGSRIYKPPTKLAPAEPESEKKEKDQISERERGLVRQAFEGASTDVRSRVNNYIKVNVEANIDPKKSMSDYVRKNATKDAMEKITDLIERDTRFKSLADRLWEASAKNNFSKADIDKIVKAYIAKGRSLLAPVVKSARNEAMRGMGRSVKKEADEIESNNTGNEPEPERRRSSPKPKANEIPKGVSTYEALNALMKD